MRYDKCDPDRRVIKLTRIGHHIWHLRSKSKDTGERSVLLGALESTVWRLKRELKAEIQADKARKFAEFKARIRLERA